MQYISMFKNRAIRCAEASDAETLTSWWNDGAVMAHAGCPDGFGQTAEEVIDSISKDTDERRRLIIEIDKENHVEVKLVDNIITEGSV